MLNCWNNYNVETSRPQADARQPYHACTTLARHGKEAKPPVQDGGSLAHYITCLGFVGKFCGLGQLWACLRSTLVYHTHAASSAGELKSRCLYN